MPIKLIDLFYIYPISEEIVQHLGKARALYLFALKCTCRKFNAQILLEGVGLGPPLMINQSPNFKLFIAESLICQLNYVYENLGMAATERAFFFMRPYLSLATNIHDKMFQSMNIRFLAESSECRSFLKGQIEKAIEKQKWDEQKRGFL